MSRTLLLVALVVALAAPPWAGGEGDPPLGESVFVLETPDRVRIRLQLPPDVDPASIEVLLAGREVTLLGRDGAGRVRRSRTVRLGADATEEGATAEYEGDGWLVLTLRTAPRAGR